MSFSLCRLPHAVTVLRSPTSPSLSSPRLFLALHSRCKTTSSTGSSAALPSESSKKKSAIALGGDSRYNIMKRVLYETEPRDEALESFLFTKSSEIEFIEKAWALHLSLKAQHVRDGLRSKYESMREAMLELENTDQRLFDAATVKDISESGDPIYPQFPGRLRPPTETAPLSGWQYERQ